MGKRRQKERNEKRRKGKGADGSSVFIDMNLTGIVTI